jgi:hypothetical protein
MEQEDVSLSKIPSLQEITLYYLSSPNKDIMMNPSISSQKKKINNTLKKLGTLNIFMSHWAQQEIEKRTIQKFIWSSSEEERVKLFIHYWDGISYVRNLDKMRIVIKYFPQYINIQTPYSGFTALHVASLEGMTDLVKLLLKNNANINIKNADNNIPLDLVYIYNRKDKDEIKGFLLEKMRNP